MQDLTLCGCTGEDGILPARFDVSLYEIVPLNAWRVF